MIRHIVLFKLSDPTPELCAKTQEILLSMQGNVPLLRGIEVGVDFLHSGRSYDICLQVLLDDRQALDAYQEDPYHCGVVKKHMHAVAASSVAIDYEL
jgi:hypothetical protein